MDADTLATLALIVATASLIIVTRVLQFFILRRAFVPPLFRRLARAFVHTLIWIGLVVLTTSPSLILLSIPTAYGFALPLTPFNAAAGALLANKFSDPLLGRIWPEEGVRLWLELLPFKPPFAESQLLNSVWSHSDIPGQLTADASFGVLRVHAENGNVRKCKVHMRCYMPKYTIDAQTKQVGYQYSWEDEGDVNWFSATARRNLFSTAPDWQLGRLNTYLRKTEEDIYEDYPKDLLLYYVFRDDWSVHFCTDIDVAFIHGSKESPKDFTCELTFTGEGLPEPVEAQVKVSFPRGETTVQPK